MTGQVIWITGLSGAGKTTLAKELTVRLDKYGLHSILLDGDILRSLLKVPDVIKDSHSREARIKLALKYAQLCKLLSSQGFTVVIATISMFNEVYAWNRNNLPNYFEVYLKVTLEELSNRDPKNIYRRYKSGELTNVAGLDLLVDQPNNSHVTFDFETQPFIWQSPMHLTDYLMAELKKFNVI